MFIPPSPKFVLHGSNFGYMYTSGIHPVSVTLAIKKPPGIMENYNVYFQHKNMSTYLPTSEWEKIEYVFKERGSNWGLKYTEDKSRVRAIPAHFSSASH